MYSLALLLLSHPVSSKQKHTAKILHCFVVLLVITVDKLPCCTWEPSTQLVIDRVFYSFSISEGVINNVRDTEGVQCFGF